MSCVSPPPRWWDGFSKPLSLVLCVVGIGCTVGGVFLASGYAGVLSAAGAAFVLLGTSNGAVSALGLGSIMNLPGGRRSRVEVLTSKCIELQAQMESVAQILCSNPEAVRRTIGLTVARVSREWVSGTDRPFDLFLICRTITVAREQDDIFGPGDAGEPSRQERLVQALHRLCQVPAPEIAAMLDRDLAFVHDVLAAGPRQRSAR